MSETMWNWENKVENLRKILEKSTTLQNTFDFYPSSTSNLLSIHSASDDYEEDYSISTKSTPSNHSERLVSLINYEDVETPITECSRYKSFESLISSGNSSSSVNASGPLNIVTIQSEAIADRINTNVKMPMEPIENLKSGSSSGDTNSSKTPEKCNKNAPNHNVRGYIECIDSWIPALEKTKSNIIKLIDDHIHSLKEGANVAQSQQNDFMNKIEIAQTEKAIQREACVKRIRDELTVKMENLNNLLDQLERI